MVHNNVGWNACPQRVITFYKVGFSFSHITIFHRTFASSAPSAIVPQLTHQFGFSDEVGTLTISLFVAGYCVGPILWGPLSEQYGRRPIFLLAFLVYTAFQLGNALAQNTAQILVFRFLGGMFAASPLTNSGAVIADIWDARTRGTALAIFTLAPFAGVCEFYYISAPKLMPG